MKQADETALDRALDRMAAEAPPMPADFREKWVKAVREDAAAGRGTEGTEAPAEREKEKTGGMGRTAWIRALSTAAVFVFLIGGTFIYRATKGKTKAGIPEGAPASTASPTEALPMTAKEAERDAADEDTAMPAANGVMAAGDTADAADGAAPVLSLRAESADYAEDAACYTEEEEQEEAAEESAKGAAPEAAAEEPVEDAAAGAAPEAEVNAGGEQPTAEPTEKPAETPAGNEGGIRGFLTDMGDFLRAAWPYLAGAAVLGLAAWIFTRKKR